MKVDDLLKRLENAKTDEDKRREIAEYLAQTFGDKEIRPVYHFMTKDKTIYDFDSYEDLLESDKISPEDAYVFIENDYLTEYDSVSYLYPFLDRVVLLVDAYLSKLGLKANVYRVIPATGLKYVAIVNKFSKTNSIVVEVADIDNIVANTNLPILILRNKYIDDEVKEIVSRFSSQKLFAGYDFRRAEEIIRGYYENHDKLLVKDVADIIYAYSRIFQPYRIEYDLKSKRVIASFERKLF